MSPVRRLERGSWTRRWEVLLKSCGWVLGSWIGIWKRGGNGGKGKVREWEGERYFLDMIVPFLDSDSHFYCFCHEAG